MLRFVLGRLLQLVVALFVLSIVVFVMSRATGDPLNLLLPDAATRDDHERARVALGLDRPIVVQYGLFAGGALRGDLGRSHFSGEPVNNLLWQGLQGSALLAVPAIVLTFAVGIPLGMASALSRGTVVDNAIKMVTLLGQSPFRTS